MGRTFDHAARFRERRAAEKEALDVNLSAPTVCTGHQHVVNNEQEIFFFMAPVSGSFIMMRTFIKSATGEVKVRVERTTADGAQDSFESVIKVGNHRIPGEIPLAAGERVCVSLLVEPGKDSPEQTARDVWISTVFRPGRPQK